MKGFCTFYSETGTEGGYWAFQDEQYIEPPTPEFPHRKWSYDGLHILENGDRLKIFSKIEKGLVLWEGVVDLVPYPVFTQDAYGYWIHADQKGVNRESWADYFLLGYPCEMLPAKGGR